MIHNKFHPLRTPYIDNAYQTPELISEKWGPRFLFIILIIGIIGLFIGFETFLTLAVLLGFVAVVVGLKYPPIGIMGVGILCGLDAPMRVFLSNSILRWNTFNYWLLFVILISLPSLLKLKHLQIRLLQFFILLLGLELIITPAFSSGVQHVVNIFIIFGLLAYFNNSKVEQQSWYWLGAITGTITALSSLIFYLQIDLLPYINPNSWAYLPLTGILAINLAMPFSLQNKKRYTFLWILAVIDLSFVFLSGSRGVLLVATISVLFLALQTQTMNRRISLLLIAALVFIAISSQFTEFQANTLYRIDRSFDPMFSLSQRTNGRSDLALGGWYIFLEHPLGIGTGGFAPAWASLGNLNGLLSTSLVGQEMQQHSAWIKVLAENGFPGFILMVGFVISFTIMGFRRRPRYLRIMGLLVTTFLTLAFLTTNFQGKGTWLFVAGAMVLLQEKRKLIFQE